MRWHENRSDEHSRGADASNLATLADVVNGVTGVLNVFHAHLYEKVHACRTDAVNVYIESEEYVKHRPPCYIAISIYSPSSFAT